VDITSNVVGRGAVVEVVDQGLGMSREHIENANQTLREPSSLSLAKLSSDSRMGLLVVSRIAARNGVTVKLSESDYGGIRAIVLIPIDLLADDVRPAGVSAHARSAAVEPNGASMASAVTGTGRIPAVPWPTIEPGDVAPPIPAQPEPRAAAHRRESFSPPSHESHVPAAGQGIVPTAGRPTLPRRRRQESLAPQLSAAPPAAQPRSQPGGRHERSAERARDLFAEIETGTRQGRMAQQEPDTNYHDGREGLR
jgi:hypothetical protein